MSKRYLLIYNPVAGKSGRRPGIASVAGALREGGNDVKLCLTRSAGDATELVKKYAGDYDAVVCAGGDGTLNETINGVLSIEKRLSIGYIPIGSTNDFASALKIPDSVSGAIETIKAGHTNSYDIGDFNGRHFNYVACFGPGTSVSYSTPQKMKNLLGYNAYMINGFLFNVIPTLKAVRPKHIAIEYDGQTLEDDFYFGAVSNSLSVAGMFHYDPDDVRLNDGKFEVLLVRRLESPLQFFTMMAKIVRRDYDNDKLMYFKAAKITMEFEKGEKWSLDGEYGGDPTELTIEALHSAVDIFSPESELFT